MLELPFMQLRYSSTPHYRMHTSIIKLLTLSLEFLILFFAANICAASASIESANTTCLSGFVFFCCLLAYKHLMHGLAIWLLLKTYPQWTCSASINALTPAYAFVAAAAAVIGSIICHLINNVDRNMN